MKPKASLRFFLIGSTLLAAQAAHAAGPYWWDNNGGTANFGTASGTWSSAGTVGSGTQGWATVSTGLVAPTGTITTLTTDAINFGTATGALGTGTITVSGTVNAGDITFGSASSVITLSGGTINLAATETITVNNTVDVIRSILSGASTSLAKAGTGSLILSGANNYTGATNITGGTLVARSASALGTGALANVSVATNTGLTYNAASNTQLAIGGNLSITGGVSTVIGTSIGTTTTGTAINVAGDATTNVAAVKVNIYGLNGVSHFGTGTATLITAAGGGSSLNNATYTLGNVYNNTDFTVGALSSTATSLTVATTAATALTTAYWKGGLTGATNVWAVSNGSTQSNWVTTSGGANQALVPGTTTDVFFGNSTITTAPTATVLGSDMSIKSLRLFYNAGTFALNADGYALTTGSGGITKDAGTAAATISSPLILGSAQTWTNNSITNLSLSATNLNGNVLTVTNTGIVTFDGSVTNVISGAGGIIKNGTGQLNLDGGTSITHTFTGDIVVNGGSIGHQNSSYLTGKNLKLTDGYLGGRFGSGFTWTGGLGTGANQIQITGGTSGLSGEGGTGSTFVIGTAGSTLKWGASGENGATGYFNPTVFLANGDHRMNATGIGSLNNSIDLNGSTRTITSLQTTGGAANSGFTISGAIVNTAGTAAGLTKTGVGNLILTAANTYNGATTISSAAFNTVANGGGAITLSGSGTIANTTALNLNGTGTLRLVNTANTQRFADVAVTSNGGYILYENTSSAVNYTETLGALTLTKGQANIVLTTDQVGTGSQKLTFGTSGTGNLTQGVGGNGAVTFSAAGAGLNATKNTVAVFGATASGAGGIIGPWATVGSAANVQTAYAAYDASGFVVAAVPTVATVDTDLSSSSGNYDINTGSLFTLAGTRTVNAVQFRGAASTLDLATFKLETNGFFFSGGAGNGKTITAGVGGALTTPSGGGNLYITAGQVMTAGNEHKINAPITNNGGNVNLVKSGSGTLILNAANTFTGNTSINAGTLQLGTNATANGAKLNGGSYAGDIFIGAGATFSVQTDSNQTLSGVISGDGNLTKAYTSTLTLSGANTYTGKTSVAPIGSQGAGVLSVSSFNSVFTNVGLGTVHSASSSLGAPTTVANGTIDVGAGTQRAAHLKYTGGGEITDRVINFVQNGNGADKTIETSGTANTLLKFVSTPTSNGGNNNIVLAGSSNGEFVGGLPFSFANLTKNDGGTWTLGGAVGSSNGTSGAGILTINGGTLALQKTTSLHAGSAADWTAANVIVNTGGTLALNVGAADEFSNADITTILTNLGGLGGAISNNGLRSGSRIGFDTTNASGGTFTIANNLANSTGTGGGAIGLTKLGTGKLELTGTNAYTGTTIVSAGVLAVNGSLANTTTTVQSGATLQGSGSIGGSVTVQNGGTLAAGNSIESLTTGALALNVGSTFAYEMDKSVSPGVAGDLTAVTGNLDILTVDLANATILTLTELGSSGSWIVGEKLTLISYTGAWNNGLFKYLGGLVADDSTIIFSGTSWVFNYNDTLEGMNYTGDSPNGESYVTMTVVPEPRAALLGGLGLLMLLRRRR